MLQNKQEDLKRNQIEISKWKNKVVDILNINELAKQQIKQLKRELLIGGLKGIAQNIARKDKEIGNMRFYQHRPSVKELWKQMF